MEVEAVLVWIQCLREESVTTTKLIVWSQSITAGAAQTAGASCKSKDPMKDMVDGFIPWDAIDQRLKDA